MIGTKLGNHWRITSPLSDLGENSLLWYGENNQGLVAAIKIPRDIADSVRHEKRRKRFKNEIDMLLLVQRLGMKSVIPVIDHGMTADGIPWYAMPIATPIELPSTFLDRLRIISQLTDVIEKLHGIGLEHLDIKQGNLLMIDGALKLSDFGHSKFTQPDQFGVGQVASDTASSDTKKNAIDPDRPWFDYDMYSLGKACWELLTDLKSKSLCELGSPDDDLAPHWPAVDPTIINRLQVIIFKATNRDPLNRPNAKQLNLVIQDILKLSMQGNA